MTFFGASNDTSDLAKSHGLGFQNLMDKILQHFAGPHFQDELQKAKKEFFEGPLDESNSDSFELRMSQFYDWYFFTRTLLGYGQTPLEACPMVRELRFSEEETKLLNQMQNHRHSLFEFVKIKGQDIYLKDLFKNDKVVVRQSNLVYGFNSEEIFEVRLIPVADSFLFTKGFCFHPSDAKRFIYSEVRKCRKDPDLDPSALMLRLVKMRFRFERYRHVRPEAIYSEESKIGL